jgi:hypothetical protein
MVCLRVSGRFGHDRRKMERAGSGMGMRSGQLTRLVYELLDAHDDTARITPGVVSDDEWEVHLAYLRDLQRVGRELLAASAEKLGARSA